MKVYELVGCWIAVTCISVIFTITIVALCIWAAIPLLEYTGIL